MEIFKILIICIISAVLAVVLRQQRPELAFIVTTACVVLILTIIFGAVSQPLEALQQKLTSHGIELSYFKIALKSLGIGYVTSFCADICRDSGQTALASLSETVGKCSIFLLSLPLVINIVDLTLGFIK